MLKAAVAQHHPDARPFTQGRDFQGSKEKTSTTQSHFAAVLRACISRRERKEEKRNKKIPKAFQGFFVHCDKTRKQMKELNFPPPPTLLTIILKITRSEGRIHLPTAQCWVFLHFIPTAAFEKYLAEAITIHCAERVTINTVL